MTERPIPDAFYAKTDDGVYLAYQTLGNGPVDLVWSLDWFGNIDIEWESPISSAWFLRASEFSRLIVHDCRGQGLSSRNVDLPNLETRVSDLLCVMDSAGAKEVVLAGAFTAGSANALFAATHPSRVKALVWIAPAPRSTWAPDYPWGYGPEDVATERSMLDHWGTTEYGRLFMEHQAARGQEWPEEELRTFIRQSRNTCTPDVARKLTDIWYETDVRRVLPAIQAPTLLLAHADDHDQIEQAEHVAALIPHTVFRKIPGGSWTIEDIDAIAEEVRDFLGMEKRKPELETVLSSVMFTDIVDSTEKQAKLGDHLWKDLVMQHHAMVRTSLVRWRGIENDTAGDGFYATFDGPARAIRCAMEIADRARELDIEVRAGVHTGECELIEDKCAGLTVSIGSRIAGLAQPSEVLVSQTVRDLVAGSGLTFDDAGEHLLKGIPDRWRLYRAMG